MDDSQKDKTEESYLKCICGGKMAPHESSLKPKFICQSCSKVGGYYDTILKNTLVVEPLSKEEILFKNKDKYLLSPDQAKT